MLKILHTLLFSLTVATAWTQIPELDYFHPTICSTLGIRSVTVYQSNVDSANARTTTGRSIRIAKNIDRQLTFDTNGRRTQLRKFIRGGAMLQQTIDFSYSEAGLPTSEIMRLYHTNNVDSTKLIQSREKVFYHDNFGVPFATVNYLISGQQRIFVDSTAIEWGDSEPRITKESVFVPESPQHPQQEKIYTYPDGKIIAATVVNGQESKRDECVLRDQWCPRQELNFVANDSIPRLETQFIYDAKDKLIELRYLPDWKHFVRAETVVNRKNTYDRQGRLMEARLEYGDGKVTLELYDYSNEAEE
ncbi:MAG: hypothetical protein RLZZ519_163 [Bacteroidota bacterium]|jgi:hypothetical protein